MIQECPGRYIIGPVGDRLELWFVFDKETSMSRYYYDEGEARAALKREEIVLEFE